MGMTLILGSMPLKHKDMGMTIGNLMRRQEWHIHRIGQSAMLTKMGMAFGIMPLKFKAMKMTMGMTDC